MFASMYAYMYVCMYVCLQVCMHVCMHACMYVCMYVHLACSPTRTNSTSISLARNEICKSALFNILLSKTPTKHLPESQSTCRCICRDGIGLAVLQLRETGELQKLQKKWWFDKGECNPEADGKVRFYDIRFDLGF